MTPHPITRMTRLARLCKTLLGASILGSTLAIASAATPFLSVDINVSNNASENQSGFSSWVFSSSPASGALSNSFAVTDPSISLDQVGVSLTSSTNAWAVRGRNVSTMFGANSTFPYIPLYRDLMIASKGGSTSSTMTVEFSGLSANTAYQFTFYAIDVNNTSDIIVTDTATGTDFGHILYTQGSALGFDATTPLSIGGTSGIATTDATGKISFLIRNEGGDHQAFLNGFQITAIPESSSIAMLAGLAAIVVCGLARRRR